MKMLYSFSTGLLLLIVFSLSGATTWAAASLPEVEQELPRHVSGGPIEALVAQGASPARIESGISDIPELKAWNRMVFESIRDGNWEIYIQNMDGAGLMRLTFDAADDIQPRLTRGALRIVFASNRTGSYELYTMNYDGSGLTRLTFTNSDNHNPAWSPDGTRIAFESYRDGQAEVYVMAANGANQTRLTVNPGFDGAPSWSPDGSRIAFGSYRAGQNRIWVMNADGSAAVRVSILPYSENPVWSPDGNWIAFDADPNATSFQGLYVMRIDILTAYPIWARSNPNVDALARSWSPDGLFLTFTLIQWVNSSGNWYWTNASLMVCLSFDPKISPAALPGVGLDLDPDLAAGDIWAPVSRMLPLPRFSRARSFQIDWDGLDIGASGILNYDIDYRVGANLGWSNIFFQDYLKAGQFTFGLPGDIVYFRSLARDNAGNSEPAHSGVGDTYTQLYSYSINGNVMDNRGIALPGVPLSLSPTAIESLITNPKGDFLGHLTGSGSYALTTQPPGYGSLPTALLNASTDLHQDFILPPLQNLIQNGGFEAGSLANWQTNPEAPALISADQGHTGQFSSRIGKVAPADLTNLSSGFTGLGGSQHILRDSANTVFVYWSDATNHSTFYRKRPAGGDWSPVTSACIPLDGIVMGPDNSLHVLIVVRDFDTHISSIWYESMTANGICSIPIKISGNFYDYYMGPSPTITIDQSGKVHAVWTEENVGMRYAHTLSSGSWSSQLLSFTGNFPSLAVTSDNVLHLAWITGTNNLLHSSLGASGVWSDTQVIAANLPFWGSRLFADAFGHLFALWHNNDFYYSEHLPGGEWSQPFNLSKTGIDDGLVSFCDFVSGPDGMLHVTWTDQKAKVNYRVRYPDGIWSPAWAYISPIRIGFSTPQLLADTGMAQVVWSEGEDAVTTNIMYGILSFTVETESSLSQTIAVPVASHQPTLSFVYKLDAVYGSNARFEVKANDAVLLSTSTPTTEWVPSWFDLSAWAGQAVTISFTSQSGAGSLPMTATVDEVSVGEWLTPVIAAASPAQFDHWVGEVITIHGANFIKTPTIRLDNTQLTHVVWIDPQTVQATILGSILPGLHDIWVVNPQGQMNELHHGVLLGQRILLPVVAR